MANTKTPYLCGGTLFFLLLTARNKKKTARERAVGMADGMADRHVMDGLVYAVTGSHNPSVDSTLKKDTSKYRECDITGSINIPFDDPSTADTYRNEIKDSYKDAFNRMTDFVTSYLDENKYSTLGKYLIEVIEQDSISDDEVLYYDSGHSTKTKQELRAMTHFEIQPLLIGIMRFILDNRSDNSGKATLELWGTRNGTSERKLTKTNLGASITRRISISLAEETAETIADETDTEAHIASQKTSHDVINEHILASGKVLADAWGKAIDGLAREISSHDPIDTESESSDEAANEEPYDDSIGEGPKHAEQDVPKKPNIQIVQNPTIYNQHAEKIYNIEHVDHLD